MMAVDAIRTELLKPRARRGTRSTSMTPMQRAIRDLDHVWGVLLVDAMLRVAQAMAMNEPAVAEMRIAEIAGHPRGSVKRMNAVRRGAAELLKVARETNQSEIPNRTSTTEEQP